jgi:type IV secretion system protein VirD4
MRYTEWPLPAKFCLPAAGFMAIAGLWTLLASLIFLYGAGLLNAFPHPYWQWWLYALYAPPNPVVTRWLGIAALVATAVPLLIAVGPVVRRARQGGYILAGQGGKPAIRRGSTDNHGHADWLSVKEARIRYSGQHSDYGGVVVGEAYRVDQDKTARAAFEPANAKTWGHGGTAPLLIDPCMRGPTHSLLFAGAGGFKTTSALTSLVHWTGSAVVLDSSCEIGPMLLKIREAMGHEVVCLDLEHATSTGFNVLDWIDLRSPMAESNVHAVTTWICGEPGVRESEESQFFRNRGREMVACLLAHMLWDDSIPETEKTLRTLRAGISAPDKQMRRVLRGIHRTSSSHMARELAGSLMDIVPETFDGIYANANESTSWLSVPAYASLVSGNRFRTASLADGKLTIFVQLPLKTLLATPATCRVIIGALLNAVYEADGKLSGRVFFLLDEVARLGPMKVLEQARDAGRKYGITMQLLYQSVGQLVGQWGRDGQRAWYDGVSWRGYAAIADMETAREVSTAVGDYGVVALSEGDNHGRHGRLGEIGSRSKGRTASRHEIRRALIKPEELLHDTREDELFVLARGSKPLRCGRAIYFRRPELHGLIGENRFAKVTT